MSLSLECSTSNCVLIRAGFLTLASLDIQTPSTVSREKQVRSSLIKACRSALDLINDRKLVKRQNESQMPTFIANFIFIPKTRAKKIINHAVQPTC